jgi:hypothetical protein
MMVSVRKEMCNESLRLLAKFKLHQKPLDPPKKAQS